MPNPLKVGLIGTGSIAHSHLAAYNQFTDVVRLTALCDIREEALKNFANEANVDALYTDFNELLRNADLDAVDICTTHDQHEPQVIAAAAAGKHILVEKPMGRTMRECREMIAATEREGVVFMVGQDLRFLPHTLAIKHRIDEGELGTIRVTNCELIHNMRTGYPGGHWLIDGKIAGGGILIWGMIHQIDLLRYYIGDVKSVSGACRTVHSEYINGAEEYACATLEFENGAIGNLLAISSPTRSPQGLQYMIFGEDGTIYANSTQARSRVEQFGQGMISSSQRGEQGEKQTENFGDFVPIEPFMEGLASDDPFVNEILHFAQCCQQGKEPITSGKDNLGTIKVVFGIYESSRTGQKIDLALL